MGAVRYGNNLTISAYADEAPDSAVYPYVVYNLNSFSYEDIRDDITLEVDIWDSDANYKKVEAIADDIETKFNNYAPHSASAEVLPIFFKYIRTKVPDQDKRIKRINLKFQIQNYSHTAHNGG